MSAAHSLNEAIERALCMGNSMPEIKELLKKELRDYFAHEVMKVGFNYGLDNTDGARLLFDIIFKDIPALADSLESKD